MADTFQIAQVCHEAKRAWCEVNGDTSQVPWDKAEPWQKQSAIDGVAFAIANPGCTPADQHQAWMNTKIRDGWKQGEVKDAEAKTHPCLVPYAELPALQRAKDGLFLAIVRALTAAEPSPVPAAAALDPKQVTWMAVMAIELDARIGQHPHRSVDWGYWKDAYERGLTPAQALEEDIARRAQEKPVHG